MIGRSPRARSALALAAALLFAAPAVAQDTRPGIAVWEFESGGSYGDDALDTELLGVGIQQQLATEFAQNPAIRVVERARLREIIRELELAEEGRVDPNTAARAGRMVGARYMILGSFMDLSGQMQMNARVVDVETTELLHGLTVRASRDELFDLVSELAARLTEEVDLPPLPAEVREERDAREIPAEAMTLYARALLYEDQGETAQAVETYERITRDFPQYTEAREALDQLSPGSR
jgi:TolB-like protein